VHSYKIKSKFIAENVIFTPYGQPKNDPENFAEIESGISALSRLVKSIVEMPEGQLQEPRPKEKLTIVLISSLADMWTLAKSLPKELVKATARIVLQGGYTVDPNPNSPDSLIADPQVANNAYDTVSADNFHKFMDRNKIPSVVFTKVAATACALP
jgi:hypothetical protein